MTSNVAVVAEGPTDLSVIRAVLKALGKDVVPTLVQPEYSAALANFAGIHGSGWKGVRSWCRATQADDGLLSGVVNLNANAVIVHVDADIAREPEIDCARPCPQAVDTVNGVRAEVKSWLHPSLALSVILCVPCDTTEAWVVLGLFPEQKELSVNPECRQDPASLLVGRTKLVRKKGSAYRKNSVAYVAVEDALASSWPSVRLRCAEAERFSTELAAALPETTSP